MTDKERSFEERLSKIEQAITELTKSVGKLSAGSDVAKTESAADNKLSSIPVQMKQKAETITPGKRVKSSNSKTLFPDEMRKSEYWLNKIGIGLFLLGIVFLFKYSVDQGWLTPSIRVLIGLLTGGILVRIGLNIYSKRRHFSLVLLGGAIVTFYISGFAAYQMFNLIPYMIAFGYMIVVSLFSFWLSLHQEEYIISIVATAGALATPFLLTTESGSLTGLLTYTIVVISATGGIYYYKGWRSLLWVALIGSWIVFRIAFNVVIGGVEGAGADKTILQMSLIYSWLLFWGMPVTREFLRKISQEKIRIDSLGVQDKSKGKELDWLVNNHLSLLTLLVPAMILIFTIQIWDWSDTIWGSITLLSALIYLLTAYLLGKFRLEGTLVYAHYTAVLSFFTVAIFFFFEGDALFALLAAELLSLHVLQRRAENKFFSTFAHILSIIIANLLIGRIFISADRHEIFDASSFSDIFAIGVLFYAIKSYKGGMQNLYKIGAHIFLSLWFFRYLNATPNLLFTSVSIQMIVAHILGSESTSKALRVYGHILSVLLGYLLIQRFYQPYGDMVIINAQALSDMFYIASIAALSMLHKDRIKSLYLLAAHIFVLGWIYREFSIYIYGDVYITSLWGAYAISLLIIGIIAENRYLRKTAMFTLSTAIFKLFFFDFINLEPIWKILMFLGFGGVFLILSYYFRHLWSNTTEIEELDGAKYEE